MPRHLSQVLAQHEFQEAFKNYRDLRYLAKNLDELERQARRLRRHAGHPAQGLRRQAAAGAGARRRHRHRAAGASAAQAVADEIAEGEQAGDGVAFADAKELDLLQRGEDAAGAIDAPGAEAEVTALRDRVRLAGGLLSWQLAKKQTDRVWALQKDAAARSTPSWPRSRARDAALVAAQKEEPARFDALRPAHRGADAAARRA